jgi:hypothetical protein
MAFQFPSTSFETRAATAAGRDRIRPRAAGQRDRPPRRLGVGSLPSSTLADLASLCTVSA